MQLHRDECVEIFKSFIEKLSEVNYQQVLEKAQVQYAVRQFKLPQLSPSTAQQIYQNISIKYLFTQYRFTRNLQLKSELNWWQNQLRIFVWTLIFYIHLQSTQIQSLTANDWTFFSNIFPHKQQILFQYQSINILREHGQAKKWVQQEDQIFVKLVKYRTYLSKGNNRVVDDGVKGSKKMEGMREREKVEEYGGRQNIRGLQKSNMHNIHHKNNINNNNSILGRSPSIPHHHSQPHTMYPFTWYKKQQSFIPFRKSQQYFAFPQYQNTQPNNIKRNFITSSYNNNSMMQQFHERKDRDDNDNDDGGRVVKGEDNSGDYLRQLNGNNNNNNNNKIMSKSYGEYYSQQQTPQRVSNQRRYPLPAEHYQPQNHFYSQALGSSSQLQLGSNYEQFLPIQQQRESIQHDMMNSNQLLFNNFSMDKKGSLRDEMDQEERKVRAEIFLLDNPIDVVRDFFYKDKGSNNKSVNGVNVNDVNVNNVDSQARISEDNYQI